VLVDAPCSGEGMFRKDPGVMAAWTNQSYLAFSRTQQQILNTAAEMVRPGGRLLYSTCTFTPAENEEVVLQFLRQNHNFCLVDIPKTGGFAAGITGQGESLPAVARLWPHRLQAEGHFLALFQRTDAEDVPKPTKTQSPKIALDTFHSFMHQYLPTVNFEGCFINYGTYLYSQPLGLPSLQGLKVVRPGLYLGQLKKQRFEPSHALALALRSEQAADCINFAANSPEVIRYLKAETLPNPDGGKGWAMVCVDGYPLGWAKRTPEGLKNYYTSAWRWVD
jgi:NOL1/NOP2/fmu family ribosome biogenesis protein